MPPGPKVKLAVDLHKMDRYFSVNFITEEGNDYEMIMNREDYDAIESLLAEYSIQNAQVIQEFCFIFLWIRFEIQAVEDPDNQSGKLYHMWNELDSLKQYLMNHRITSISFHGEYERARPGKTLVLKEEINIDRLCDGIRSIFREEFLNDKQRRRTKGQRTWQRRKMVSVSNNILNYFTIIPELDALSLEEQRELIDRLASMAGLPEN